MLKKLEKMEESDGYAAKRKKYNNRVKSMAQDEQIQIFHTSNVAVFLFPFTFLAPVDFFSVCSL